MKRSILGLLALIILTFSWFYFLLSGLDFNPMYGDDYRSLYVASTTSFKDITLNLMNPIQKDYYSQGWADTRPVYFYSLKTIYHLFGSESYWYYLWRAFCATILVVLIYLFFYQGTQSNAFSLFVSLFFLVLPLFYYSVRFIADQTLISLIFMLIALIILLKFLDNSSLKNLFLLLFFSYLSIKSRTDGKLLLPIIFTVFASNWKFSKKNLWKVTTMICFIFLTTIPLTAPFSFPPLDPITNQNSLLDYWQDIVIQKKIIEQPYGIEKSPVFFSKPFPLSLINSDFLVPPFSFFSSSGPFFMWLLIISILISSYFIIQKKIKLSQPSSFFMIIFAWVIISSISIAMVGTKIDSISIPRYSITFAIPASLLLFYTFYKTYTLLLNNNYKKIFFVLIIIFTLQHVASGFFYQISMRGIDGSEWYAFNEVIETVAHNENKSSANLVELLYESGEEFAMPHRIILEHYNYVIHSTMTSSSLESLMSSNKSYYFVDFRAFDSKYSEDYLPKEKFKLTLLKEINLQKKEPYTNFKRFIHYLFGKKEEWFARVYLIEPA